MSVIKKQIAISIMGICDRFMVRRVNDPYKIVWVEETAVDKFWVEMRKSKKANAWYHLEVRLME